MKKTVIVINGQGGCGKDTICTIMSKYYNVKNISTVDPIKAIAKYAGWQGEKGDKARKMLADLKQVFIEYNDLPLNYVKEEIAKIVNCATVHTITLLVKRLDKYFERKVYGNSADDDVENYNYDFIYCGNNETIEDLEKSFMEYFNTTIKPTLEV